MAEPGYLSVHNTPSDLWDKYKSILKTTISDAARAVLSPESIPSIFTHFESSLGYIDLILSLDKTKPVTTEVKQAISAWLDSSLGKSDLLA